MGIFYGKHYSCLVGILIDILTGASMDVLSIFTSSHLYCVSVCKFESWISIVNNNIHMQRESRII